MSLIKLAALLAGAAIAAGTVITIRSLIPRPTTPRITKLTRPSMRVHPNSPLVHATIAATAGLILAVTTGWWVAIAALPIAAVGLPHLFRADASTTQTERLEAMAEWTRSLSGMITGAAVGLPEAITATVNSAPKPIAHDIALLSTRLTARWSAEDALWALADDLNDPTGDLIAGNLLLGARERGPRLATVLTALAKTVADDVTMRRRVEADRSSPRTQARLLAIGCPAAFVIFVLTNEVAQRYHSLIGQSILLLLLGAFAGCLYWLYKLSLGQPSPRYLIRPTPTTTEIPDPTLAGTR